MSLDAVDVSSKSVKRWHDTVGWELADVQSFPERLDSRIGRVSSITSVCLLESVCKLNTRDLEGLSRRHCNWKPNGAALHWTARNKMGQMRNFKVYAKEQEILETVRRNSSLIITGRPGSGKTQFLVPLLLSATAEEWFERATWSIVHTRKAHVVLPTVAQVRRAVECAQSLQRSTVGHDCAAGVTGNFKLPIHGGREVIRYMIPDLARRDLQYLGEDDFFVLEEFDRREAFTVALRSLASWRVAVRQNLHLVCLSASAQLDLSQYLALSVETTVVDISNQPFGRLDIEMLVALASQHKVAALPYLYSQRRVCRDRSNLRFVRQCSSAVDASFGTSSVSCGARI
jgi:hypothetical protein